MKFSIRLFDPSTQEMSVRTYWVSDAGGYVRDVTDAPGTLGRQVSWSLAATGDMMCLSVSDAAALPRQIRLAQRRRLRAWRKWGNG